MVTGSSPSPPVRAAAGAPRARRATDADAAAMGAMFARAFADDPTWSWL